MFSKRFKGWSLAAAALAIIAGTTVNGQAAKEAEKPRKGDVYSLDKCIVSGQKLGSMGDPVIYDYKGREIRFCCKGCVKKFEAEPTAWLKKIDVAMVKAQLPYYTVKECVVTGEKLGGAMGKPVDYVYNNRLVRFCCSSCVKTFDKSPAKYTAKLDKAVIAKQTKAYPLDTCVVLGSKLGTMGKPVDYVTGNRLVRLCCKGCVKALEKEPAKYLGMIDKALKDAGHDVYGNTGEHQEHEAEGAHEGHSEHGMMHDQDHSMH